ncbi:hypothetical protein Tco_0826390 [Tanacetum coccineum]
MMAEIQDVHMFKRKSLRVTMFRMMLGTHRELFELRLQDLLQMLNATVVMLLAKHDEAGVTLTYEQNDFLVADATRIEEIKELSANICLMARIQPANIDSDVGPSYDSAFLSENLASHLPQSCLMLTLEGFPFITVNTKEYHSECSGNYRKDNA